MPGMTGSQGSEALPSDTGGRVSSARARFGRAVATHGARGLPFAVVRRAVNVLEDRLNPRHVNRFDFGYSEVFAQPADAINATYSVEFQTLVIELPLSALRWSRMGLRLDDPAANPFVQAVVEYHSGRVTRFEDSTLKRYFDAWHPASTAEVLGLDPHDAGLTAEQPPQAVVLPWAAEAALVDPARRLDRVDRWNREESRSTGVEVGVAAGHKQFGPVSNALGRLEFRRYGALTDAVVRRGFMPRVAEGYIGVQLLVDGPSHAAVITGPGLHRAVVAGALGVDPLTVAVDKHPPMVHRSDVASWPGVCSGLFSHDSALRAFDRMLAGAPPRGLPILAP